MQKQIALQKYDAPLVGIDIGGTNTRIGLFPSLDAPAYTLLAKFPTYQEYEQQLRAIGQVVLEQGIRGAAGIGVSIAARIAKDGQSVIFAPNLPGYVDRPFAFELAALCAVPVRLAHDTVCGLLAEARFGVLRMVERCAYLTVSTGTGAAIQLAKADTRLVSSIEIGHQILDGNSRECLCGMTGCLETYTGGRQLELRYGQPVEHITESAFWETFAEKLAIGLVNLAQLTRIDMVAVSGAIALNRVSLLPALQKNIDRLLMPSTLELRLAELGETAPLAGAALLPGIPENEILH
ncbi:MAG TPA: ROK family protein [Ktedonobacteraceae bacterium]